MATARGAALAAAVRMVDRVHGHAAHYRTLAEPPAATGLADYDVLVVRVADGADRGDALGRHDAQLARVELDLGVACILADQLDIGPRRARELPATALLHLDVMHDGADRHVGERHGVARLDVDALAGHDLVARLQALRGQDVGKLAIGVLEQ